MTPITLDLAIASCILVGGLWGFLRGAIRLAGPFALATGLVILANGYPEIVATFRSQPELPSLLIGKIALFGGLMLYGILARFLHRAVHLTGLGIFNRLAGVVFGGITGIVVAGCGVWAAQAFLPDLAGELIAESRLAVLCLQVFALLSLIAEQLFHAKLPA